MGAPLSSGGLSEGLVSRFAPRHASEEEYREFLVHHSGATQKIIWDYLRKRRRFAEVYADFSDWFRAPLPQRVGRVYGRDEDGNVIPKYERILKDGCYYARPYLYFLALRGYLRFDWEWIVATRHLYVGSYMRHAGMDKALEGLCKEAENLGYTRKFAHGGLRWVLARFFLRTGSPDIGGIGEAEIAGLEQAVRALGERDDIELFFGTPESYAAAPKLYHSRLHMLGVVLYHRGQLPNVPRKGSYARPVRSAPRPRMVAIAERYVAVRGPNISASHASGITTNLRAFIGWVSEARPEVESFAEVDREMVLEYAAALAEVVSPQTGRPLYAATREGRLGALSVFFRDTADWGWDGVPGRPLLSPGDFPKRPRSIPRYMHKEELEPLMEAVRSLECPFQRTAILVARWSGARSDEIRRLDLDCLDSYPDGTPRLRIPAGKTKKERVIPLNEEAAAAIRELQRVARPGRGLPDRLTGEPVRYLFTDHGKLLTAAYLFDTPLKRARKEAGLPPTWGGPGSTAHRFRHTVGTQLAEKGAKLHTIMAVLGHDSPEMSMVYARISDEAVRKDYEKVLGPGVAIAGPLAEALRSGDLPDSAVDWLKTNFFKTELELGHCLRLPQEGPCECDLYLSCAKFVTTKEYAPRLRTRRQKEFELIEDAISNGWEREVERHRCTVKRIEQLLTELGEPLEEVKDAG